LPPTVPVQAPAAHPFHEAHSAPLGHCALLVHQQGTPAAVQVPLGEETVSQLPAEHDHASAVEVNTSQSSLSAVPLPVQPLAGVHWLLLFTHLPLEQLASAVQRQAVPEELSTGEGAGSEVVHAVPALLVHATELGAAWQPLAFAVPEPVQLEPQAELLTELGTHLPLSHCVSFVQKHAPCEQPALLEEHTPTVQPTGPAQKQYAMVLQLEPSAVGAVQPR
jgi:hypothetical protein